MRYTLACIVKMSLYKLLQSRVVKMLLRGNAEPDCTSLADTLVRLPIEPVMQDDHVDYVISVLADSIRGFSDA